MYIVVTNQNGQTIGYFQLFGQDGFSYTDLATRAVFTGRLRADALGPKRGVLAQAGGFSCWLSGIPLAETDRCTVEIGGASYMGVRTFAPPGDVSGIAGDGRAAPSSAKLILRLLGPNVVTVEILQSPAGSVHFSVLSHSIRATTGGSMGFDATSGKWLLQAGSNQFAEMTGLDGGLRATGPIRIRFTATKVEVPLTELQRAQGMRPVQVARHRPFPHRMT